MSVSRVLKPLVAAGVLGLALAMPASAVVIGFEDFVVPNVLNGLTFVPTSYQGLQWTGGFGFGSWVVSSESSDHFEGVEAHAGQNYAWSNGATDLSMSGAVFDLQGFWARIGNVAAGTAVAHGLLNGVEIYTMTLNLTDSYAQQNLGFLGIDEFRLTNQDNNVLLDEISINNASVPEPGTLALAALGWVAAVRGLRRRRSNGH